MVNTYTDNDKLPVNLANFRMMIASFAVSRIGISSFSIMVLWITLRITGSPVIAGFADGLFSVPLLFSFLVGTLVDRSMHKKMISIVAMIARGFAVFLIFLAAISHIYGVEIFLIYLSVVLVGFTSDVTNSIRSVWFKIFLSEERYQKGSAIMNGIGSIAEALGYVMAGVFLFIGTGEGTTALAIVFLLSTIPLIFIRYRDREIPKTSVSDGLRGGFSFLLKDRFLQEALFLSLIANMSVAMIGIAFTVLVQEIFHLPAIYLSLVFIAISAGIAAGSLPGAKLRGRLDRIVMPLLLVVGLAFVSVNFIRTVYFLYIPIFVMGAMIGMINPPINSILYKRIPSDIMARIMGLFNTMALSMTFLSGAIGGVIIQLTSSRSLFIVIGVLIVACALVVPLLGEFRKAVVS
ncbi:H+ Antiporter protein [Thermoplasmatales archaeon]|nr:H+ Antiporter protein [Thermoplasmatales archaeon]